MGNLKFKLSDMIPNAWFYKLKDMSKPSKPHSLPTSTTKPKKHHRPPPSSTPSPPPPTPPSQEPQCQQPRKSYHFTRDLPVLNPPPEDPPLSLLSPPRKSKSRKPTSRKTPAAAAKQHSSSSSLPTCRDTTILRSHRSNSPETTSDIFPSNLENAPPRSLEHLDIIIDVDNFECRVPDTQFDPGKARLPDPLSIKSYKLNRFDFRLPPIITKQKQSTQEEKRVAPTPSRRFSVSSPAGVRLKINSPKIMGKKQGQNGNNGGRRSVKKKRRSLSESFAVVKSSEDPQRDFKESMVEMIVQNNLMGSKDLEDLLACYLSLNSDEYHEVIIKVFRQIWYDLSNLRHHHK